MSSDIILAIVILCLFIWWPILHFVKVIWGNLSPQMEDKRRLFTNAFGIAVQLEAMKDAGELNPPKLPDDDKENRGYA